jgi:dGTPase
LPYPTPIIPHLRFPVENSRGRRYPEPEHPYRNLFQRDRDRIVHTRAFRRLEAKTQVFAPGYSDHFRNRLTHTLEVAQIARTLASVLGLDEDLTEALALAHDVGHPPFAHAGEDELDRQMMRFGEHFDHNAHALLIVESFERRYLRFDGLNLSFEVREGIAKHSRDFEKGELPLFDEYLPGLKPPLEAQLIDLADEVAYNTADLDDGYSAGLLTSGDISGAVPAFAEFMDTVESQFPGADARAHFNEAQRNTIDLLVSGLIEGTAEAAVSFTGVHQVREHSQRLVRFTEPVERTNRQLKDLLHRKVYHSTALTEERKRSSAMISHLFQLFMKRVELLPERYQEEARTEPLHRVVCNYIAGMTDGYFVKVYEHATSRL